MKIGTVGVVGSGQMGCGIAQVCAQSGYEVVLSEIDQALLQKGLAAIGASLDRSVKKEIIGPQDRNVILGRISGTVNMESHHRCDLVIEAVTEDLELKKRIFSRLDGICLPHAVLASNTSSLSVKEMALATGRPERVIGLHFFNPVPVMALLELIRTDVTADETVKVCRAFGETLGKTIVVVQDSPGFIVNRLMVPQILTAIRLVEANVAGKEDIDTAMALGLNHPIGPLALADLVGLDTLINIALSIYEKTEDPQYAPPELLKQLVAAGHLGRKTKQGFYQY